MKNVCLEALDPTRHFFKGVGKDIEVDGEEMVGVSTDGMTLIANNLDICGYPIKKGTVYKVSIVESK